MKIVILCGGKGTRMGKDLEGLPKALISVGDKPIIWHIMKYYSYFGLNDFILCLGYKGESVRKYFKNSREFKISFCDTGLETNTGARIKKIESLIDSDTFCATYGDGLANINLNKLLDFHKQHKKTATLTVVKPSSPFGIVGVDSHTNAVTHFEEKPILDHWINGGFFVFNKSIFRYLKGNNILEKDALPQLVKKGEIAAFKHAGFWECMDTYKDNLKLNQFVKDGNAPWIIWKGK
ncbi:MAG: sugar phosphate nucleotidyltransferase [Candidatus Omnitrophica bacterium]|nr:sugar phosphate nucleotidyltransferase [Candidatus Omnitrophota bacterium]